MKLGPRDRTWRRYRIRTGIHQLKLLPQHDAVLLDIGVDRVAAGQHDDVTIVVEWLDARRQNVTINRCYNPELLLNFGVLDSYTICATEVVAASGRQTATREQWARLGVGLHDLNEYRLSTNLTASVVVILARSFEVSDIAA